MKPVQEIYVFGKAEIKVLRELAKGENSVANIQKSLSVYPSLLYYHIKKLLRKGIIRTTGRGAKRFIYFNDGKHISLLKELLTTYGNIEWEKVLTEKAIEILFQAVSGPRKEFQNLSKTTLLRHLENLKAYEIVKMTEDGYVINPKFPILIEFLKEYQRFFAQQGKLPR
ncbi:MAG: winged helix-turn-helix domain-containing protein [Candidatus Bathyarchaeia archaeon]